MREPRYARGTLQAAARTWESGGGSCPAAAQQRVLAALAPPVRDGVKGVAVLLSWVQVRRLPRRVYLLAGDLGERREGLGIGVVVKHVLAGPPAPSGYPLASITPAAIAAFISASVATMYLC